MSQQRRCAVFTCADMMYVPRYDARQVGRRPHSLSRDTF